MHNFDVSACGKMHWLDKSRSNPPVSQQIQFLSPPQLKPANFLESLNHSRLKYVRALRFDSCSLKAGHSSLSLHCQPFAHSPAKYNFKISFGGSLNCWQNYLQQMPFSSSSHLRSSSFLASLNHSGVNDVSAWWFACSSRKAGQSSLFLQCNPASHLPGNEVRMSYLG